MTDRTDTSIEYMLTTVDNPFDPFTNFNEWFGWDEAAGYHTSGMLDRIVKSSYDLSDADQSQAIQFAIDEIIEMNTLGLYRKVSKSSAVDG